MDDLRALGFSRYATRMLAAHPADAAWLQASADGAFDWASESAPVDAAVDSGNGDALARAMRLLRRRVYLHVMARDLAGVGTLEEVCGAMTALAECTLTAAVRLHHGALAASHGEPRDGDGSPQQLIVVGMGKLGGGELNVSSDIDLIYVYPHEGETAGPRELANREFFDRLGRRLSGALHENTADGYVFRVDTRLRPYGDSGPLTLSFAALEQYLVTQGRAWERYAWLKARPLTGDRHQELAALIEPFVFRKYLDYDAYEGLRDIHRQIREQGQRKDLARDVKLGPGGIREIEFTVQALQLVRGGREPLLRARGTLPALAAIASRRLLADSAVAELTDAYRYLRALEHRLQYRDDQQTQRLPGSDDELGVLAQSMGHADVAAFERTLDAHRAAVSAHFESVFGDGGEGRTQTGANGSAVPAFDTIWREAASAEAAAETLRAAGFTSPDDIVGMLQRVRRGTRYLQLPALSRDRFDALVPRLLEAAAGERDAPVGAQALFVRLLSLLETVSRRSAYLALLIEHPPLLPRLAHLMAASSWGADYLTRHPILLDELLDARALLSEPDWQAWYEELARVLADHPGDVERQMDALRHFQHAQTFRLLSQDLAGTLTVERLADHLSALADAIVAATVREVWAQVAGRHAAAPRFAVIGYGKLGGKELGYASDLDLVFLYDDQSEGASERYARLAQRLIVWLTSTTAAGVLYDTDLRLRPDGAAGLMVSSAAAFWRYQREHAWTWEHQALTRARFVAGDGEVGAAFERERIAMLRTERDTDKLRNDIVEMRQRMHAGHPNRTALFDLKHDPGGMVDVEFTVQYLVLAHSVHHPELTRNAGNIALLHIAARLGLLSPDVAAAAADAYRTYRRRQHQLRLNGAPQARVPQAEAAARRQHVLALWTSVFGGPWR